MPSRFLSLFILVVLGLSTLPSHAQIFFDNSSGDGLWSNPLNWNTDALPVAADNSHIGTNLVAEILSAGAVGDILRIGHNNPILPGPGTLNMNTNTATLNLQELRIGNGAPGQAGTFNFGAGTLTINEQGGAQTVNVGYDAGAPGTFIMGTPGGNDADTRLNYNNGRFEVGRVDLSVGTFIQHSGTVTGNENFIIGQGGVDNQAVVELNGGSFTTTAQLNMNNGNSLLTIDGGALSVNDLQMSSNGSNTSIVHIASGSMTITDQLNDRNGTSVLNLSGSGELLLTGNATLREVEHYSQAGNAILNLTVRNSSTGVSAPLNIMTEGVFTNSPLVELTPGLLNNGIIDGWIGGIGTWDDNGANWDLGLPPDQAAGGVVSGQVVTVITSPNPLTGKSNITANAGWTVLHPDDLTVQLERSGASLAGGATQAAITNLGSVVSRDAPLRIANEAGADATLLTISTGSLTLTSTNELMLGGGVPGTINQNGGAVTLNDDLRFGPATNSADGGTYNLNAGSLNILGEMIESAEPIASAQFHIDGGILNMINGGPITVQSFRTGNAAGSTGTYTTQGDITTTGTLVAGTLGNGTMVVSDATHTVSTRDIIVGNQFNGTDPSSGRLEILAGRVETRTGRLAIAGNGTTGINQGTVGDVIVGTGLPGSEPIVTVSGSNTEVGFGGAGTLTINSGSYTQQTANIVIGQGPASTGTMTVNGGSVHSNGELNFNNGVGVYRQTGGNVNVGTINQSLLSSSSITLHGGEFTSRSNLITRAGSSELNLGGDGTLVFSGAAATRAVDHLNHGTNGVLRFNLVDANNGISVPLSVNSNATFSGSPIIEVDSSTLTAGSSLLTTNQWSGGNGDWDASGSPWNLGTIPAASGLIAAPFAFTAITTSTNTPFVGANLLSSGSAGWQVNLPDPSTIEMELVTGTIGSGTVVAAITGATDQVTRHADLLVANEAGADASQLEILNGSLILSATNDLIIGGAVQGIVNQHDGNVDITGNIIYGPTGAEGGVYNLNGGTLNVIQIVETAPAVNQAQFHFNGGSLAVSNDVVVQRFSVAERNATNSYTVNTPITTTGTFASGGFSNSVGTVTLNNTNFPVNATNAGIGQGDNARGTLRIEGGIFNTTAGGLTVGQNGEAAGTVELRGGTLGINGGDLILGQNNNTQGTLYMTDGDLDITGKITAAENNQTRAVVIIEGGTADLGAGFTIAGNGQNDTNTVAEVTIGAGGGATNSVVINVSGGNTELGHGGSGTWSMLSGTYNQLSNNLVLGQGASGVAVAEMIGGVFNLTNDINFNRGNGTFNHFGGDINVRDLRLGANNGSFPNQAAVYNYNGLGSLNPRHIRVADQTNGEFNHDAGDITVRGHLFIAGNSGNQTITRLGSTGFYNFGSFGPGTLTVAGGNLEVGRTAGAQGTFNHANGDVIVSDQAINAQDHNLVLAQYLNSTGTYHLAVDGGTLTLNRFVDGGLINFNQGNGHFIQDGGTVMLNGGLINMGNHAASVSRYDLNAGSVIVRSVVNNGGLDYRNNGQDTFNLNGGELDLGGGRIQMGNRSGTNAFNFIAGTLKDVGLYDGDLDQQGGTLVVGGSIGTMRIQQGAVQSMPGNYSLAAAGTLELEIDGTAGAGVANGHDQLIVSGDLTLAGTLDLQVNYAPNHGDGFTLIDHPGTNAVSGTFAGLPEGATVPGGFKISYTGGDGNDVVLTTADLISVVPVPQDGGSLELTFSGLPGVSYLVEYADNTVFPPYTWILISNEIAGPDGSFSINHTPATLSEIYRARTP